MARRTSTVVTLEVQLKLPPGVTNPRITDFLFSSIHAGLKELTENDPMNKLRLSDVSVMLTRRSTTYV